MSAVIRPAALTDLAAVVQVENACFSVPWSEKSLADELQNPDSVFLAAEAGGAVCGFCSLRCLGPEAEILNVAVLPDCRRQGMGALLVSAVLAAAGSRGVDTIFLEVRASNAPAIGLYSRHGFAPCGRRKNYYERPTEDAILMKRSL